MKISVLGAGAFGTALAVAFAKQNEITLIARDLDHAASIEKHLENKRRLPGVPLPESLTITADPTLAEKSEAILLAVPMQTLADTLQALPDISTALVACCKGIDLNAIRGPLI